jgi:hypothetical protein
MIFYSVKVAVAKEKLHPYPRGQRGTRGKSLKHHPTVESTFYI